MKKNKINFETIFYVALIVLNIFVSVLSLFSGEYLHTIMYMAMAVMWLLALSKDMEIKYLRKVVDLQRQCAQENEKALMSMWNCCAETLGLALTTNCPNQTSTSTSASPTGNTPHPISAKEPAHGPST